ncbi:MAG: FAD-dependent oxidoreductase [Rubrimonas sp.]|uniref:NAD(P)/FAD-dependent oxidoreductase n=1 Tax=Rubrimonas sp. TaxID=2036015 RepID=UPI002FDD46BA
MKHEASADDILKAAIGRRALLRGGAALTALGAFGAASQAAVGGGDPVRSSARIVIAGAGAAGLACANQLSRRLDGAKITLIDARARHLYQPGFTLIAAGLKDAAYSISTTAEWVPQGVELIEASVAEFDPEGNKVVTDAGQSVPYDFLIVATGLKLDWDAVEGFDLKLVGTDGIGAVYAGPEEAAKTWIALDKFADRGGVALFGRPATEMKCAGAPLKFAFITDDHLRRRNNRTKAEIVYAAHSKILFSVPIVDEKVRMLFEDRGFETRHNHVLKAIDPAKKIATYATPEGDTEIGYDFTNVIPPMRAPDAVRLSPLAWTEGPFAADGWTESDMQTLRHKRFANVFSVGDVAGVPKGKTAASAKWQAPVVVEHLVADIAGTTSDKSYNGYTSCPLITKIGRAMLVEFDYRNNLVPSFPGVIAPLEELWLTWLMKEVALKPTYLAMVRGEA